MAHRVPTTQNAVRPSRESSVRPLLALVLTAAACGSPVKRQLVALQDQGAFIEAATIGLFDDEDAATLCSGMVPGSAVAALAIEHTWAVDLANAIAAEGGEMAANYRIPAPIVDEAFASLS